MIKVEKSVVINKPVAEVYAFVTSNETTTQWQGGVTEIIPDGQPNVIGTKYTEVRKFMGQEMRSTLELITVEMNCRWAAKVIKGPVPYVVTINFEPCNGGTHMTTSVEGEPTGFLKLAEGAIKGQLEKSLEEDSNRLKGILEGA